MRLLIQSSRRFFRRHPGQLALALAGVAAGVAVMTGVALMRDVLLDSLDNAGAALTGSETVRVTAPNGPLPETLVPELALQPGSPPLVPVLSQRLEHERGRLELLGVDPFSLGGGRGGLAPGALAALLNAPDAAAATSATLERLGVAVGDRLSLALGDRRLSVEVAGVVRGGRALDDRLVMDIAAAQDLLERRGELSWIDAPAGARSWLLDRLPEELTISTAGQRRESAARLTEGMRANLTAMGLISLAVGLFVIFSVLSFLLVQRRRTLAMLRAVGVTSARISALLIGETALIAGLGALFGLALGTLLASQLIELVRTPAAELYNLLAPASVQPTAGLYASVWLLAVGMALAAVSVLLREARRIPPGRLLRSPPADRQGMAVPVAAVVLIALALAALLVSSSLPAAFGALFLALGGFALLAPAAGIVVLDWLRRAGPLTLPGRALALLLAGQRRIRPAIAALSLALALAAGLAMMVLGFRAAVDDWIDRLLRADSYVTDSRGGLSPRVVERIKGLPGVAETSSARRVDLPDGRELIAYDLPPSGWAGFEWLAGEPGPAFERFRAGRAVVISEPLARRHDLGVGDTVTLPAPGDELTLPVAGIYRDYASERGTIAIHAPVYRQRFDDDQRDSLGLYYARPPPAQADLRRRLADIDDSLRLTGREQVRETTLAVFDRTFRISWALAAMVGVIAVIALVSALLALALERRRDYATLRALGLTPAGLHGLVVCQTAGLALAAALVAVPLAVAIHLGLSLVIQPRAFGWSLPLSWPLAPLAAMLPLALLCGVLAGLYPAWRIGRRDPAGELRGMMRRDALILAAVVVLLVAWLARQTVTETPRNEALSTGALLDNAPESFRRVTGPRAFHFPDDHAAHPGYRNEWWYFTGNLDDADGRAWGFQFTLFRFELDAGPRADSAWAADTVWMAHLALSDVDGEVFHSAERFARGALGLAGATDERWWLHDWQVTRSGETFRLEALTDEFGLSLDLEPQRPIVLQGEGGYSRKGPDPGNASHYYSITRLAADGALRIDGRQRRVSGRAWLDREWGSSQLDENLDGWDWFSLQLEDGRDVMVYRLRDRDGGASRFSAGKVVYPDGSSRTLARDDFTATPQRRWRDDRGVAWPVDWRVEIPSENLALDVKARFDQQRWMGAVSYWEGAVAVRDADSGEALGRGYLELSGYGE